MKNSLRHIAVLIAMIWVSISCQKGVEMQTRSSYMNFYSAYAAGVAAESYASYSGVVASRVANGGEWISAPFAVDATSWSCVFVDGQGNIDTYNDKSYNAGTYDFYLLGSNGRSVVSDANGRLEVSGGEESGNDYIWAEVNQTFDGVTSVARSVTFTHLFSQVRFELSIRGVTVTEATADVAIVDISGLGYRTDGVIDIENIVTPVMQPSTRDEVLSSAKFGQRYMVVPHNGTTYKHSDCTIRVRYKESEYEVPLSGNLSLNPGKCRVIRLVYDRFSISQIEIPSWNVGEDFSIGRGASGGYEIPGWNIPEEN